MEYPIYGESAKTDNTLDISAWRIRLYKPTGGSDCLLIDRDTLEVYEGEWEYVKVAKPSNKKLAKALQERMPKYVAIRAALATALANPILENRRAYNKLWHECVYNPDRRPLYPTEGEYVLYPQETLRAKKGKVTFHVSYTYNGGMSYHDKWYAGWKCQPPIVPKGFKLVDLGVGHEMNASPPLAIYKLERIKP